MIRTVTTSLAKPGTPCSSCSATEPQHAAAYWVTWFVIEAVGERRVSSGVCESRMPRIIPELFAGQASTPTTSPRLASGARPVFSRLDRFSAHAMQGLLARGEVETDKTAARAREHALAQIAANDSGGER